MSDFYVNTTISSPNDSVTSSSGWFTVDTIYTTTGQTYNLSTEIIGEGVSANMRAAFYNDAQIGSTIVETFGDTLAQFVVSPGQIEVQAQFTGSGTPQYNSFTYLSILTPY